ncbi:hypothetical protein GCM10009642_44690 [Nocardiopsis metallicus]
MVASANADATADQFRTSDAEPVRRPATTTVNQPEGSTVEGVWGDPPRYVANARITNTRVGPDDVRTSPNNRG